MLKILGCITYDHDLRLVAMSAVICVLGCITTTTLLARSVEGIWMRSRRWLAFAAMVFGCSVWSLHFVAMLAFMPNWEKAYDVGLTALSILVASGGAMAALLLWQAPSAGLVHKVLGGVLLGLAITGMHYIGVDAVRFGGVLVFDPDYVAASVIVSIAFASIALVRANQLEQLPHRLEVASWLALAICGLYFTGMTAISLVPSPATDETRAVLGTTTLAIIVGGVSVFILIASLTAAMVEQFMSERALQDLDRMRLLSNLAQEVLLIHSGGIIQEVNSAGERLFKAPANDIIGRPILSLFNADNLPALRRRECCHPSDRHPEEMVFQAVDGTQVPVEFSCQPIDYLGKPATAVALRDLTARKLDEARIRHLARHDTLTSLPNRHTLLERLDHALDTAAQQQSAFAIAYIDLDRFKQINDLHGHAAGDALLIQVSKRILNELHTSDTLARIGGDEFIMLIASEPQPEKVSGMCTRVIEALRSPFEIDRFSVEIGASVGVAMFPADGTTPDALLRAADTAMYRAKQENRGSLRFFETSMNVQLQARLQMEKDLVGTIERGEMMLDYQPLVNGVTGEVETFEALVRWCHPRHGRISPADFIPLAEECGMIDQIGRWVIETAFRNAAQWPKSWGVAVNVSPTQFRRSDICGIVESTLRANRLKPSRVVVEVTEGVLIEDAAKAVATLNRLRELGVRIALDDFGTGYSSLSYLQLFKFDELKIDKSFTRKLGQSEDALTIVRTIINLGHNLGLQVTVEGVETQAQLAILQSLGCDQIQGFLVGKPGPVKGFSDFDQARTTALFKKSQNRIQA